jgi:hypothetical protein
MQSALASFGCQYGNDMYFNLPKPQTVEIANEDEIIKNLGG